MRKLISSFYKKEEDDVGNTSPSKKSSLQIRAKSLSSTKFDNSSNLINQAASGLADSIQNILSNIANFNSEDLSDYQTLLDVLDNQNNKSVPPHMTTLLAYLDNPNFVEACFQTTLATGLYQALRLLRMLELIQAKSVNELEGSALTIAASSNVSKLLEKLCTSAVIIEQLRPSLVKLLIFPLNSLPKQGKHLQTHSAKIVNSICRSGFTSQQVWFLHDCHYVNYALRALSEMLDMNVSSKEDNVVLLRGANAEAEEMWLEGLKCIVDVISTSLLVSSALLTDFEMLSGNKIILHILNNSTYERFLRCLNIISALMVCALKKDEEAVQFNTVTSLFSDCLSNCLKFEKGVQRSDSIEVVIELSQGIFRNQVIQQDKEFVFQGLSYAILTLYSTDASACTVLEEKYNVLPTLMICIPSFTLEETISAILTTFNYICQCVESNSTVLFLAINASLSVMFEITTNQSHSSDRRALASHFIDLCFASIEAITRSNTKYSIIFLRAGLLKNVIFAVFEKLALDLRQEVLFDITSATLFEKVLLLLSDLAVKSISVIEEVRKGRVTSTLIEIIQSKNVPLSLVRNVLQLFEEMIKTEGSYSEQSMKDLITLLTSVDLQSEKMTCVFESFWKLLIAGEGKALPAIQEVGKTSIIFSLDQAAGVFNDTYDSHLQLVSIDCLESLMRFSAAFLFYAADTLRDPFFSTKMSRSIVQTGIFTSSYANHGVALLLDFATIFTKERNRIDTYTCELLWTLPSFLDKDGIRALISCLSTYLIQDSSKCILLGECEIFAQFFESLYVNSKGDLDLEKGLEDILCLISKTNQSIQLTICVQRFLIRSLALPKLDNFDWWKFVSLKGGQPFISSPNISKKYSAKLLERKVRDYFPDFDSSPQSRSPFGTYPSFDLPMTKIDDEYFSLGSLALFFNESTVLLPATSLTICFLDRVIISLEMTIDIDVMLVRFVNLETSKEELMKFRCQSISRLDLSTWTNVVLTVKRTRRFAQSNQVTCSLFINGLACQVIGSAAAQPNIKCTIDFDCLTGTQHGEIRLGFSKQVWSNYSSMKIYGKVHFATFSVFNEALAQKQVALLFLKGPNYVGLHQHSENDATEHAIALSSYSLLLSNSISRNPLQFTDQLGLKGVESLVAPRNEPHDDCITSLEIPELPDCIAAISPFIAVEDPFSISLLDGVDSVVTGYSFVSTYGKKSQAFARPRRFSLYNLMDLESENLIGVLNSPAFITHQLSLSERLFSAGSIDTIFPLLLLSEDDGTLTRLLLLLKQISQETAQNIRRMQILGYKMLGFFLSHLAKNSLSVACLHSLIQFGVESMVSEESRLLVDTVAFSNFIFNHHVWNSNNFVLFAAILKHLRFLITDEKYKGVNIVRLSCLGFVRWTILGCMNVIVNCYNTKTDYVSDSEWTYRPRSSLEMADRRDEPEEFLVNANIVVCTLMSSELRSKDLELLVNTIQYTLNYAEGYGLHNMNPQGQVNKSVQKDIEQLVSLHPFCTYETDFLVQSRVPDSMPYTDSEKLVHQLSPFEFYRIYLLRLLVTLYDDNLEELRKRRSSTAANNNNSANLKASNSISSSENLELYREKCSPEWFLSILERTDEIATRAQTLRLLAFFLEKDLMFARDFIDARGFQVLQGVLCSHAQTIPVLLPICSILFRLPNQLLLYPFQLKTVQKLSQLLELEEQADFTYVTESWLTMYSLPLLSIFYECLIKIIRRDKTHLWHERAEELLVGMLDSAVHYYGPFKKLMQHKIAIEIHINSLLSCSNAFSDYGSIVYGVKNDAVDLTKALEEDYISAGKTSTSIFDLASTFDTQATLSMNNNRSIVEEEKIQQEEIVFSNSTTSIALQRMIHYFLRYAIRDEDNSRILYHLFLSSSALISATYECSYQTLITQIFSEVAKESQGLENSIIASIVRNIIYVIPLVRGLHFYDTVSFELMKVCISLVETISSMYEVQELTENLQFILKDLVGNARFLCIILVFMIQTSSFKCTTILPRLKFMVFIRTKLEFFLHPLLEDTLEGLLNNSRFSAKSGIDDMTITAAPMLEALHGLTSGTSQRKSAFGLISNIRMERNRCSNVFCAFLACSSYNLVLDEEALVRVEATRILAFLSQRKGLYMEQLLGNTSPFVLRVSRGTDDDSGIGVDIYKEGLLKLVPNNEGKYQLYLRGGTDDNESEDNRFADFSFWISDNSNKCDAIFRAIESTIQSVLPNINSEAEELARRLKHKPRARDLFSFENADSVKASLKRQQIGQNHGQRIGKIFLNWKNEGIKDLTSGSLCWKKIWNNLKSSPLWGYGRILPTEDFSSQKSMQIPLHLHDRIVWRVDYCEGPEKCRKKLLQDLSNLSPVLFGLVPTRSNASPVPFFSSHSTVTNHDKESESIDDILHNMQKQGLFRRPSTRIDNGAVLEDDSNFDDGNAGGSMVDSPLNNVENYSASEKPFSLRQSNQQRTVSLNEPDDLNEIEDVIEGTDEEHEFGTTNDLQIEKPEEDEEAPVYTAFTQSSVSRKNPQTILMSLKVSRSSVIKEIIKGIINFNELKNCRVYNIERISGLETQKGIFVFSDNYLHLLVGFVVTEKSSKFSELQFEWVPQTANNEGKRVDSTKSGFQAINPSDIEDSLPQYVWSDIMMADAPYFRIPIDEVYSFFKRRFQLKYCALEVSDVRGASVLFSCESQEDCDEILTALLEKDLPSSIFNKMIGLKNLQLLRGATNMYNRLVFIFLNTITQLWQHGEITNFEYLMYVNSAAGRSFLDLTQYPIFPWVLADYKSEELDFDDISIYRDLSKPMGALGPKRAQQYLERYQTMDEFYREGVEGSSPPFFYGTHYSCAGYVLHYLVRLQPYTNMSLALQGGCFDKADRLFCSVESSWISASSENLQDVRELIPEFYYLPDFLININHFDLGVTQSDRRVDNVKLPPWARNDPTHFVKMHRQALESKYVSENLHSWIDLIFGFKQRGKAAIEAMNVFIHITYEGEVDLDAIDDPILQSATLAQINNFGQTPTKLYAKPHPRKVVPEVVRRINDTILVEPTALIWHNHLSPPLTVVGASKFAILKCVNFGPATFSIGTTKKGTTFTSIVADIKLASRDKIIACSSGSIFLPPNFRKVVKYQLLANGLAFQTVPSFVSPRLENEREISYHEHLHNKKITAITVCKNGEFIVTGSEDLTVRIWQLVKTNQTSHRKLSAVCTFVGHAAEISCLDISAEFNIVISGGADRRAILWDYRSENMIRILSDHIGRLESVSINTISGNLVTLTKEQVRIYHLNGQILSSYFFSLSDIKKSIAPARVVVAPPCGEWQDGVVAVTGHVDGGVYLWKMSKLTKNDNRTAQQFGNNAVDDERSQPTVYSMYIASSLPKMHKSEVCCLKLCSTNLIYGSKMSKELINKAYEESRNLDLFVGDVEGNISRWTSAKLDQLPSSDLISLLKHEGFVSKN